jgi:hypothetical protein
MSVARGTKIGWIYYEALDSDGRLVSRQHLNRVTKPYVPLEIIDSSRVAGSETKTFIECAFPVYRERKDSLRLAQGSIDAYLDAKSQADFLETRGAKLAVALEILKNNYLHAASQNVSEYIIDPLSFESYEQSVIDAVDVILKEKGIPKKTRDRILSSGKIQGLNRASFANIASRLLREIKLRTHRRELSLFIESRNKLVHTGKFFCQTATEEDLLQLQAPRAVVDEYFFMVHFLDRIFLKLLGYSGTYLDWSDPRKRTRATLA